MKKILFVVLAAGFVLSACTEDEDPSGNGGNTQQKTTQELVMNKWNIATIYDVNYVGSTTTVESRDTLETEAGDYIEFQANNKAVLYMFEELDTIDYNLINDNTIQFDGDAFDITSLTESEFIMTYMERADTPYYDNVVRLTR